MAKDKKTVAVAPSESAKVEIAPTEPAKGETVAPSEPAKVEAVTAETAKADADTTRPVVIAPTATVETPVVAVAVIPEPVKICVAPCHPGVGRIVRYVLPRESPYAGQVRPAVVSGVNPDGSVTLIVFKGCPEEFVNHSDGLPVSGCVAGHLRTSPTAMVVCVPNVDAESPEPGGWFRPSY